MSKILSLNRKYGSFFMGCGKFAFSPYTNTFMTIANPHKSKTDDEFTELKNVPANLAAATIVTGVLTFIFPVLPILTSITSFIAAMALLLAIASMCVTYPIALAADACDSSWESRTCPA
jgi:hypothetical protein